MKIISYKHKNEERDKRIIEYAKNPDLSYEYIGQKFNLSRSMISHIAIKGGVVRRPEDINPKKWARSA